MNNKIKIAVFPGSFDPLTNGHTDIIDRSLKIFDVLHIAVLENLSKTFLFTPAERVALIQSIYQDDIKDKRIVVTSFSGLLVDFVSKANSSVVIRGLRAISDYDYEAQMALMNRQLNNKIETLFMMTREENSYISSTLVKQVVPYGGDVSNLVPPLVVSALKNKFSINK